jgi:hypothetical protein
MPGLVDRLVIGMDRVLLFHRELRLTRVGRGSSPTRIRSMYLIASALLGEADERRDAVCGSVAVDRSVDGPGPPQIEGT